MANRRLSRVLVVALCVPLVAALTLPAGAARPAPDGWVVVRFDGRITAAERVGLATTELTAVQYYPTDSYLAYGSATAARAAAALPGVTSVRGLRPSEKIHRGLTTGLGLTSLEILAAEHAEVRPALENLGTVLRSYRSGGLHAYVVTVLGARIADIATDPAVLHVGPAPVGPIAEDEGTAQILAGNFRETSPNPTVFSRMWPAPGYANFLQQMGVSGEGVIISIADTGIDKSHPEFQGRVVKEIAYGVDPQPNDLGGHGTHVAGIVGGKGAVLPTTNEPARDADGLLLGHGVAPKVSFLNQAIIPNGTFVGGPPNSFDLHTSDAVANGAVAWNASWNTGAANSGYVARARSLDLLTRDAAPQVPGNQPFTMVFSAGNSGSAARTITQPKEAKNIITVASTHSQRVSNGSVNTISSFSSRGPTKDNRLAPTVAAPGQAVVSSTTSASPAASCASPTGADGAEAYVIGQTRYAPCSGTSMAAPHVTGAVALITDWWRDRNAGADPSPAMNKAMLVNTATDMGVADIPNNNEGWGRLNLARLFDPSAERIYVDQSVLFTGVGQSHSLRFEPADPTKAVKVTLAWTDAAAVPNALIALVNNLNLTLTTPDGTTYLGNAFVAGSSATGGTADNRNNVESVFLPSTTGGVHEVTIGAANLPGNGIPGNASLTDQDFALVVSNARPAS